MSSTPVLVRIHGLCHDANFSHMRKPLGTAWFLDFYACACAKLEKWKDVVST
jgi:hypothetical protein